MSSPARIAAWTGEAPRQAGSSEKCRLTQPCVGNVQHRLRQQGAVGHHRGGVRCEFGELVQELRGRAAESGVRTGIPASAQVGDR